MPSPGTRKPGKQPEDHKPSLKDRLRAKKAHTVTYRLAETDDARELLGNYERLQLHHALVQMPTSKADDDKKKQLADDLAAVEKKVEASDDIIAIKLRGLSSAEWSDLNDTFTVPDLTDEEKEAGEQEPKFDREGFTAALLSISAFEAGMDPDEWAEILASGQWSRVEVESLRNAALQATNGESPSAGIPKG